MKRMVFGPFLLSLPRVFQDVWFSLWFLNLVGHLRTLGPPKQCRTLGLSNFRVLGVCPPFRPLSVRVCLSICLFVRPAVRLSLALCLFVCLSVCLSLLVYVQTHVRVELSTQSAIPSTKQLFA